jgi:hypothetical protein
MLALNALEKIEAEAVGQKVFGLERLLKSFEDRSHLLLPRDSLKILLK